MLLALLRLTYIAHDTGSQGYGASRSPKACPSKRRRVVFDFKDRLAALGELLGSMLRHWVWALTSSAVIAVLDLAGSWASFYSRTNPNQSNPVALIERALIVWALLAIPIAVFLAWCDQRGKVRETNLRYALMESELASEKMELTEVRRELATSNENLVLERQKNTPKLRGQIKQVMFGGQTSNAPGKAWHRDGSYR